MIARVIDQARVTTVVHSALMASPRPVGGRVPMQEMNVIGTMQLLAACQKSETVRRLVVKSTTAVYGCDARDPAVFTEDMHPPDGRHVGYAKDAVEVEGYVRGFARRRPDIDVTVLRLSNVLGPTAETALTSYLAMPVVPTALGFDPRLQLLHEDDAAEALRLATTSRRPGTFNVAGDGVMLLSQIVRRAGRVRLPVPSSAIGLVATALRNSGVVEFAAEESRYLNFGRAVDTRQLREGFGYTPRYSTAATVDSFVDGRRATVPRLGLIGVGVGSRVLEGRLARQLVGGHG
jgi:UDP-glucose 4-epimerase